MNKKIFYYFEIASKIARRGDDRDHFLGAIGLRSDGAIVSAFNGRARDRERRMHAEYRVSKKLDYGATVYVARVLKETKFGIARPCISCMKALKTRGVKRVYYTIGPNEYGWYDFESEEEK